MVRIRIGDTFQEIDWSTWEESVRDGRIPSDALVQIPALTGSQFVLAETLENFRSLRDDARMAWQRDSSRAVPPLLTALLVGVQIRLWWLQWDSDLESNILNHGLNIAPRIFEDGQSWRLITNGFLQNDFLHLTLNMVWLALVGASFERVIGWRNLLTLYLASVVGGSLLSATLTPWSASLGSSGGVFGLIAAVVVFGLLRPELLSKRGRPIFGLMMLPYLALMFWSGLQSETTDNWAHFGGLVTGTIFGSLLDPEPVQRRQGWNRYVRGLTAGAIGLVLAIFPFAGPHIHPLATPEIAAMGRTKTKLPPTLPQPKAIDYFVPAGWISGVTAAGDTGFTSEGVSRSFSARDVHFDMPPTPEQVVQRWTDALHRGAPDAQIGKLSAEVVANASGFRLDAFDSQRQWTMRFRIRGRHVLQIVWEVDEPSAVHLGPLRDRLIEQVVWNEPPALMEAKANWESAPDSLTTRAAYAELLMEYGDPEQALTLWQQNLGERPSDALSLKGLLRTVSVYPKQSPNIDLILNQAISDDVSSSVLIEVIHLLETHQRIGEANGLLELAWLKRPGDRDLARERRNRGLGVALDPKRMLPMEWAFDISTNEPRSPELLVEWSSRPLSLAYAKSAIEFLQKPRVQLADRVVRSLSAGDPTVARWLVLLKYGAIPEDFGDAWDGVREDIRGLEKGKKPEWMSESVAHIVQQQLVLNPQWFENRDRFISVIPY